MVGEVGKPAEARFWSPPKRVPLQVILTKFEREQIAGCLQALVDGLASLTSGNVAHRRGMYRDFAYEALGCMVSAENRALRRRAQRRRDARRRR